MAQLWREAASLIIVGRNASHVPTQRPLHTDYNLLLLKRSQKSSFMPNRYVFPGGVVEASDFSEDWLGVFEKCGYTSSNFKQLRSSSPLSRFFLSKPAHYILPEVGFRIGAIREAFEESGILLANHLPTNYQEKHDIEGWRKAIHKDASKFLALFDEMGGCPAVWDLHEWISWLTPSHFVERRFDTIFFITFMDHMPKIAIDSKEITGLHVTSPPAILEEWRRKKIWLAAPQVYEISRFLNFQSYEKLKIFASQRGKEGLDHYFPVMISASNGKISVLPGDDLYPADPDYTGERGEIERGSTIEELRKESVHFNRAELKEGRVSQIMVNVVPKYGHIQPLDFLVCDNSEF